MTLKGRQHIVTCFGRSWTAKPRGRPRVQHEESAAHDAGQGELGL